VNLREKFAMLQMKMFYVESSDVYSELIVYFYSNISVLDLTHIQFIVSDKVFNVYINLLADILGVERSGFLPINVSNEEVTKFLVKDRIPRGSITYSRMSTYNILLHKIVINCIKLKIASKTDVSRFEANMMWTICNGVVFFTPHTILLHMYRTVIKGKGQLSHTTLVTKLFRYF